MMWEKKWDTVAPFSDLCEIIHFFLFISLKLEFII